MKKTFLISCSLLIASLLLSCDKESNAPLTTIVSGRVLEHRTNKPIVNARISVSICDGNFNTGQVSCPEVDSLFTDVQGNFSYNVPNSTKYNRLHFLASKKHYRRNDNGIALTGSKSLKQDMVLYPDAWLNFAIEKIPPFDEQCIEIRGLNYLYNTGCRDVDNSKKLFDGLYKFQGNDTTTFALWVTYSDGRPEKLFPQKIYLRGLDTTNFILKI